jgi:hypothetical protein
MRAYFRWIALMMVAVLLSAPSWAEESKPSEPAVPAEEERKFGWIFLEAADWVAEPAGLEYAPATVRDTTNPYATQALSMPSGTENRARYRAGYLLPGNGGDFVFTWYSHAHESLLQRYSPGSFVFGETAAHPLFAGIFDDGTADGFSADTRTVLRDMRIDFYRIGFQSARMTVRWFVGFRRVVHDRSMNATYYALSPIYQGQPIPPTLYPPDGPSSALAPIPDVASIQSEYVGRGVEAGAEITFPLTRRFSVESGFTLAMLKGRVSTSYSSLTHVYALMEVDDPLAVERYLEPPFSEFETTDSEGNPTLLSRIRQLESAVGLKTDDSASGQVIETYVGLRWKAWRNLEAFGGYRDARYTGQGADIRPKVVTGTNLEDVSRTDRSVDYVGFYLGVSYRF